MAVSFSENITRVSGFLSYFLHSKNRHGIHSPFVYELLTNAVYLKTNEEAFRKIENIRSELLSNKRIINVTDLGAGSSYDTNKKQRTVSEITRKFAKSPKYCRLLFRLTQYFKPGIMVELGTSLGISSMYQSSGNPQGRLFTLEGCPETAAFARENLSTYGYKKIDCITGNFDETLEPLLKKVGYLDYLMVDGNHTEESTLRYFSTARNYSHEQTLFIFDDINWSEGMRSAWKKIKEDDDVTITIDFHQLGLVFFDKRFSKQDFLIRY